MCHPILMRQPKKKSAKKLLFEKKCVYLQREISKMNSIMKNRLFKSISTPLPLGRGWGWVFVCLLLTSCGLYNKYDQGEEVKTKTTPIPLKYSGINNDITERILQDPERFTFGMAGLAEVLHCSIKTAYNYRSTGEYDPAIIKFGKRIIIDKVKVTEIAQAQGRARTSKSKAV